MDQDFLDFFVCDAVVERSTQMKAKFFLAIQSDGHGQVSKLRVWRERPGRDQTSPKRSE